MDITSIMFITLVLAVIAYIVIVANKSYKQRALIDEFAKLKNFDAHRGMISNDSKNGLAIDNKRNQICILKNDEDNIHTTIYKYKDLLESEILEDGESVTKTSRGSQLGGALLGGLALGGVGVLLGGLSGKQNNINTCNSIDLKIIVNDFNSPMIILNFFKSMFGIEKSMPQYKENINSAREWNSLLSVLIKKADEDDNKSTQKKIKDTNNKISISVADEIIKLKSLKEEGVITKEEFEKQKNNILS